MDPLDSCSGWGFKTILYYFGQTLFSANSFVSKANKSASSDCKTQPTFTTLTTKCLALTRCKRSWDTATTTLGTPTRKPRSLRPTSASLPSYVWQTLACCSSVKWIFGHIEWSFLFTTCVLRSMAVRFVGWKILRGRLLDLFVWILKVRAFEQVKHQPQSGHTVYVGLYTCKNETKGNLGG